LAKGYVFYRRYGIESGSVRYAMSKRGRNIYRLKKGPIIGAFVKKEFTGMKLVAVPNGYNAVIWNDAVMRLENKKRLHRREFPDRFNREILYTLNYYEWQPDQDQPSLF
jgi:hypothetical protein